MHTDVDTPPRKVRVQAPGRLHLGFLDPSGSLGRRWGSLGLVIEGFETAVEITAAHADRIVGSGPAAQAELDRAQAHLAALRRHTGRHEPLQLSLEQVLPAHAGFGSGTQLALAVGRAFALWHGLAVETPVIAQWLARGLRSGVGIAGFDQGGLLVDGGPSGVGRPAPVLARLALPEAWRIVVAQDLRRSGLAGRAEREAIAALPPMAQAAAADICHRVLMQVLPGAAHGDFDAFAQGVSHIQAVLGEHFAPVQGGRAYTSPAVGRLLEWIGEGSRAGIGQSSWGPTGFVILPSQAHAEALVEAARTAGLIDPEVVVRIAAGRNRGAAASDIRAPARAVPQTDIAHTLR